MIFQKLGKARYCIELIYLCLYVRVSVHKNREYEFFTIWTFSRSYTTKAVMAFNPWTLINLGTKKILHYNHRALLQQNFITLGPKTYSSKLLRTYNHRAWASETVETLIDLVKA